VVSVCETYYVNNTKLQKKIRQRLTGRTPYIPDGPRSHGKHIWRFDDAVKLKSPYMTQSVIFILPALTRTLSSDRACNMYHCNNWILSARTPYLLYWTV